MVNLVKKIIPWIVVTLLAAGGVEIFYRTIFARYMAVPSASKSQDVGSNRVQEEAVAVAGNLEIMADHQAILTRNLFGTPPAKAVTPVTVEPPTPAQLAATALDLGLLGTITGLPNNRRAIIIDKKKKIQDIYYQGDEIQGALIKEIQRGKVILNVNGKDEILAPETPKSKTSGTAVAPLGIPQPLPVEVVQEPPPEIIAEPVVEQPEPLEPEVNNRPEAHQQEVIPSNQPPQRNTIQEKP